MTQQCKLTKIIIVSANHQRLLHIIIDSPPLPDPSTMSPSCIHPPGTTLCIRVLMYDSLTPVVSDTPFSPVHNTLKFAQVLGQVFV